MSHATKRRDEGMPQAPDSVGLPDLAPARTEASPPNVPKHRGTTTSSNQPGSEDDIGDNADGRAPRPDFGPAARTNLVTAAHIT